MKPLKYAQWVGKTKETVYNWIRLDRLPDGARAVKGANNRFVIHVDLDKHPDVPLYTDE